MIHFCNMRRSRVQNPPRRREQGCAGICRRRSKSVCAACGPEYRVCGMGIGLAKGRAPDWACGFFLTSGQPVDIFQANEEFSPWAGSGWTQVPCCNSEMSLYLWSLSVPPPPRVQSGNGRRACLLPSAACFPTGGRGVSAFGADVARTGNPGSILEARPPCSATRHHPCCL